MPVVENDDEQDGLGKFISTLENSELGKIIAIAKKVQPWVSFVLGILGSGESDIQRLENRIETLTQVVSDGFTNLGDLIERQTRIILGDLNKLRLELAQKEAEGAMRVFYTFKTTGRTSALDNADSLSGQSISFLQAQSDPFYLPGLLMAGSVRLDVLNALQPNIAGDQVRVNEIIQMADGLTRMINTLKERVDASHKIERGTVQAGRMVKGDYVDYEIRCLFHTHKGQPLEPFAYGTNSGRYAIENPGAGSYNNEQSAWLAAERTRKLSVQAELSYLQVPVFEDIRDQWRRFPEDQMFASITIWIAKHPIPRFPVPFIASLAQRPLLFAAEGLPMIQDGGQNQLSDSLDPLLRSQDARPLIVTLLTMPEFRFSLTTEGDDVAEKVVKGLVALLFNREIKGEEQRFLVGVHERQGYEGLAAVLVYGQEYNRMYGYGVPIIAAKGGSKE